MKLLIVDDEIRAVQALVKRVNWQEYGFELPLAAYSMAQAQGVFQQQEIYLMLCDIEMPQGSGLELFEWVKTYYPLTECIFVTCHDEYSYLRSAMQLGSCDYLLKPINYTLLQEALKNVVERIQRRKDKPAGSAEQPKDSLLPANTLNVSNPYIRQLLHVLSERLTENLSIPELADSMSMNEIVSFSASAPVLPLMLNIAANHSVRRHTALAECGRRLPCKPLEHAREVGIIIKPAKKRHLGNRQVRIFQILHRKCNSS